MLEAGIRRGWTPIRFCLRSEMILVVTDTHEDYAADLLIHGLCALKGADQVVDYPRKAALHHEGPPVFDCHVNLATPEWTGEQVAEALRNRVFDLVVVPTLRGTVRGQLMVWDRAGLLAPNRDRIVAIDGEDHAYNTRPLFAQCLGAEPVAYFKRELPLGETWAIPLPFGYPVERIITSRQREGVAYTAHLWDWCGPESMRRQLHEALGHLNERVGHGQWIPRSRLSVGDDHAWHQRALLAVSPAGQGYFTNRHLQCIADGCCPILERPSMTFPMAFADGVHCRYFHSVPSCLDLVEELLAEPERAQDMAVEAQAWLRQHHTTEVRARTVWDVVYGQGVRVENAATGHFVRMA